MIAFFSPSRAKNQLKISFHFAKKEPAGDRIDPDLAICPCLTYNKSTRHFSNKEECEADKAKVVFLILIDFPSNSN